MEADKGKDNHFDDGDSSAEEPVSSFQSYAAEGDILAKQGEYRKAVEAYSKALNLKPGEKNCLVSRSKCYLQLGDAQASLADAQLALQEDKEFFKGIYQKAEALYAMGDFEMALVFYHRGNKLRPELDEFRLGIQKAREAIDNSIGNPRDYKLQSGAIPPEALNFARSPSEKPANWKRPVDGGVSGVSGAGGGGMAGYGSSNSNGASWMLGNKKLGGSGNSGSSNNPMSTFDGIGTTTDKSVKQLLGELYADREYLQRLLNDRSFIQDPNDSIYALVLDGIKYLETRTEFWRQQKPMYARKKEQKRIQEKAAHAKTRQAAATAKSVAQHHVAQAQLESQKTELLGKKIAANNKKNESKPVKLEGQLAEVDGETYVHEMTDLINNCLENGEYENSLKIAKNLLVRLNDLEHQEPKKYSKSIANSYSLMGTIYLELGSLNQALEYHLKDLAYSRQIDDPEGISRALGNSGRIHAKLRNYTEAEQLWEEKLTTTESPLEKAWLHHDIGRCRLALGDSKSAVEYGEKALQFADEVLESRWILNAGVLIGQSYSKLGQTEKAIAGFERARAAAEDLNDQQALAAIERAIVEASSQSPGATNEEEPHRADSRQGIQIAT